MQTSQLTAPARSVAFPTFGFSSQALTLENLFASQPVEKLAAGAAMFWEGDGASHLFQVVEGCLRLYRILSDGRRAIMGFRFSGETLGVSCQGYYDCTAEAVTPVRLRRLSRKRLHVMEETMPSLQPLLMEKVFEEMRAAQKHIIVLGQFGAEERVANFLMSAALRTGADRKKPVAIELPMTRLDIADYLGLTIETVCRAISKLKRDGAIVLQGRHRVVLLHMDELQNLAGLADSSGDPADHPVMAYLPN